MRPPPGAFRDFIPWVVAVPEKLRLAVRREAVRRVVFGDGVELGRRMGAGPDVARELPGGAADSLVVITANGQIIRMSVAGIRECGRGSSGVKVVDVAKNDRVISASVIPPESP